MTPDFQITSTHRTATDVLFWLRKGVGSQYDALYPANFVTHLTIVNQRNMPIMIRSYKIEMQTNLGTFVTLRELTTPFEDVYAGSVPGHLSHFEDPSLLLGNAIRGRSIPAYQPVSGWAFFQFPKDNGGVRFDPIIKVTISDYGGTSFTTDTLHLGKGDGISAQAPNIPLAAPEDLSFLPVRFVNETGGDEMPEQRAVEPRGARPQ